MGIERNSETKWIQPLIDPETEKCPALVLLTPVDLQMSNMHIPMVLSFPNASSSAEANMEKGLSRVLAHYLEMAGRLGADQGGRRCIHLSNEGVPLVLAKSPHEMDEFLEQGKHDHLDELLASSSLPGKSLLVVPLLVQITRFACGGITLGLERHHHVVDGTGNAKFILDWASCSRLEESFVPVTIIHDRPWLMPREPPEVEFEHPEYNPSVRTQKVERNSATTVSVTFDVGELASIKSQCGSSQQYSTFVSLSAHLWRSITAARKLQGDVTTHFVCPVDGRRYLGTPVGFFGNAVFRGFAHSGAHDLLENPLSHAAALVHAGVKCAAKEDRMRSVVNYLSELQKSNTSTSSAASSSDADNAVPSLSPNMVATSWSRFPLYDADFGFGYPKSLSSTGMWTEGAMTIAPSSRKDGSLEVFVTLLKDQVHEFLLLLVKWNCSCPIEVAPERCCCHFSEQLEPEHRAQHVDCWEFCLLAISPNVSHKVKAMYTTCVILH